MKLAHYLRDARVRVAIVRDDRIYDLRDEASRLGATDLEDENTIDELLARDLLASVSRINLEIAKSETPGATPVSAIDVKFKSPILSPEKILMIAINYASHSREQNIKPPEEPYVFSKFRNALIGPGDAIIIPKISKEVDWEVELAVVIGRPGKNISKLDAMNYVAGYTVANDVSFRDMQFWKNSAIKSPLGYNWFRGKGLDNALPLGPYLVTLDEISDPYSCELSLSVNGITRQKSVTGEMLIKIDSLIEYVSAGVSLRPGDLICTGTPLGVAAFTGVSYLKEGDIVEAKISGIGSLRNPVIAEV